MYPSASQGRHPMDPRRGPPPPHHVYPQQPVPTNPMMMMARSQYGAGRSQQQQAYNGHQYPPTPLSYPHPQQSQTAQRGDGYYDPYIYYQDSQRGSHPGRHYQQPPPQQQQQHSQPYPMMVRLQHPPPPSASFVEPSRYGYPPPPQRQYSHSQMQPYPSQYYNSSGHPAPHYSSLNHPPPPFYAASAIAHVSDRRISSRDKHRGREGIVHPPHQGLIVNGEVYNESMESQTPITPTEGPLSTPVVIVIDDDDIATESITKSPEGKKKRQLQLEKDTLPSPVSASHEHAPNALPAPPVLQTEAKPVEKQACTNLPKNTGLPTKPLKESIRCKMCNIYFTGMGAAKMHLTDVHKYGRHPHVGRKDYQRLYGKYLKWISVTDSESVPVDPSLPSSPENVMDATEPEYDEEEDEEEEDEEFLPPLRSRRNKRRAPPSPVIQQPPTRAQRMRMRERQQEPTQALTYSSQRRKATIETPPPSNDPPSSDMVIEKILIQRIKSLLDRRFGPSSR